MNAKGAIIVLQPVIIAAVIVAVGVVASATTSKNTYQIAAEGGIAFRLDTRTGEVRICVPQRNQDMLVIGGAYTSCLAPLR